MTDTQSLLLTRRQLLVAGGAAASSLFIPTLTFAKGTAEKSLKLFNIHSGEWFKDIYWMEGKYIPESLKRINHLFRDRRSEKVAKIDPRLLDLLNTMQRKIGESKPFDIVCGYRSAEVNRVLHKKNRGVAKNSLHVHGKAVDIRVGKAGADLRKLRDLARAQKAGGVGYYPKSGFIHVDIRPKPYYW